MCTRIDVAEYWSDLLPLQCMSGRYEGEGWDNDLTTHTEGTNRNFQSQRSITNGDAVPNAEEGDELLLEFLNEWSIIREPATVEHVLDPSHKALSIADIWSAHV